MRILTAAFIAIGIWAPLRTTAQEPAGLVAAKAMDQEIEKLGDLPDEARARAVKDLALRIRKQPARYAVALASNLVVDGTEAIGSDTLQDVTTTLVDALRNSPVAYKTDVAYMQLAELARYGHAEVSLDDPRYTAAVSKIQADDQRRSEADFTLTDIQGRKWTLKSQRGKVVLVNFWATWCPPCRREIPDLEALDTRFRGQGLVILAITDEEASKVMPFLSEQKVRYFAVALVHMSIRSQAEFEKLRVIGRIVRQTLDKTAAAVRPGITTGDLDEVGAAVLAQHGAESAPYTAFLERFV